MLVYMYDGVGNLLYLGISTYTCTHIYTYNCMYNTHNVHEVLYEHTYVYKRARVYVHMCISIGVNVSRRLFLSNAHLTINQQRLPIVRYKLAHMRIEIK